ncbi:MAG: carboxylate--amine ligase [Peptoniphilaceae bacterium]|nr:carboxylate--amine ligase [Peptoniphilaceae bacterium]MDD7383531.1 carboxylate--amine ligase [Peptoniphilaceae bacterium]MDY3738704.1 carboxylate--amine ligase [Peptoniphilaceae bacterium]
MDFLTVILGTDINAYGVARSVFERYGKKSLCLGVKPLNPTRNSKITDVEVTENFDVDQTVFLNKLEEVAKRFSDKNLLLIPCSDGYVAFVSENKNFLKKYYKFNIVDFSVQKKLENKKDFYEICKKYNLDYPKTYIFNKDNFNEINKDMEFPIVLKPNDSISYLHVHFEGKKKAYTLSSLEEYFVISEKIYKAGYDGEIIIQEYIPGDATTMYVLNTYSDRNAKVKMMCLGKCLLDECLPTMIGNYNALLSTGNKDIYEKYRNFLEKINYTGFADFDFKWDYRDKKFKVFEINLRQGRSSFYTTNSGCNFMKFIVEDLIEEKENEIYLNYNEKLWLYVDPYVLKNYVAPKDREYVKKLLKEGFTFTEWYKKDISIKRFLNYMKRRVSTIKYYPKYEKERLK